MLRLFPPTRRSHRHSGPYTATNVLKALALSLPSLFPFRWLFFPPQLMPFVVTHTMYSINKQTECIAWAIIEYWGISEKRRDEIVCLVMDPKHHSDDTQNFVDNLKGDGGKRYNKSFVFAYCCCWEIGRKWVKPVIHPSLTDKMVFSGTTTRFYRGNDGLVR